MGERFPGIEKTIRTFADANKPGVCIWYDSGEGAMNWLHEMFGVDFDTPSHIWHKVARLIERSRAKPQQPDTLIKSSEGR